METEEDMVLVHTRSQHCSIVIIGGTYQPMDDSISVQAIDTTNKKGGWRNLKPMKQPRYSHGCHVCTFEGQTGILVAGGYYVERVNLGSVEFYLYGEDRWIETITQSLCSLVDWWWLGDGTVDTSPQWNVSMRLHLSGAF